MLPQRSPIDKILSSGIVVFYFDGDRYRLLALRKFEQWDFPKAFVEAGSDPLQSALQTVRESTGLTELKLKWGEESRETIAFDDGSVSRYFLAESASDDVVLQAPAGAGASDDFEFRWVTAEDAEEILPPRLALILDWALARLAAGP
jgi:hypothetical protein